MRPDEQVGRAYRAFAPLCDAFFATVLEPGLRVAICGMNLRPGERVGKFREDTFFLMLDAFIAEFENNSPVTRDVEGRLVAE